MSIKTIYNVCSIDRSETIPWLKYRHYAHRIPSIMYAFGLYKDKELVGVCTFGMPCCAMNNGICIFNEIKIRTVELNRLVIEDSQQKNIGSFFISQSLKKLPSPICVVSFADPNYGHLGYIYQATNFLYTGLSEPGGKDCGWYLNNRNYHGKTITANMLKNFYAFDYDHKKTLKENWIANGGHIIEYELKHRYIKFLGSKSEIKKMHKSLKYQILPYPKGDNQRYDASAKIPKQERLL